MAMRTGLRHVGNTDEDIVSKFHSNRMRNGEIKTWWTIAKACESKMARFREECQVAKSAL